MNETTLVLVLEAASYVPGTELPYTRDNWTEAQLEAARELHVLQWAGANIVFEEQTFPQWTVLAYPHLFTSASDGNFDATARAEGAQVEIVDVPAPGCISLSATNGVLHVYELGIWTTR